MLFRFATVSLVALAALSACTKVDREAQLQEFSRICQIEYGFKPETPEFSQCMMALDQSARADADRRRMAAAAALQGVSNGYYNAANRSRSMSCTSTPGYGGTVKTNCY